jgi:hypothetical protein
MRDTSSKNKVLAGTLIIAGWVLLALNIWVVLTNPHYGYRASLGRGTVEIALGYLIHLTVLGLGVVALSLVAWLHFKQRYGGTPIASVLIIMVLSLSLAFRARPPAPAVQGTRRSDANLPSASEDPLPADRTVTGIVFSPDRPSAVVGSQVLYEGDATQGVTVVRIYRDKVQFERDGVKWTQAVNETPSPRWE